MKKAILFLVALALTVSAYSQLDDRKPDNRITKANYALAERFSAKKVNQMVFSTRVTPTWFSYDITSGQLDTISKEEKKYPSWASVTPDGKFGVYAKNSNLWIMDAENLAKAAKDQKYALQQLGGRYSFIDLDRVGIHGHSGGGFMSTAAILKYPDFFKVAVSCAGNHDNSIYNRWWSEQHHGVLEKVDKGDTTFVYSIDTNQEIAKNLKGHLMLVHGDIDNNVHPANTIRVVDALIRANKRFDMLILPGQRHGFGDMNEYFFWRMADYYSEWLIGDSQRAKVDIIQLNND